MVIPSCVVMHVKRIQELRQCLNCLRENPDAIVNEECHTTVCGECFSIEDVCSTCRDIENVHWAPVLRRWDRCIRNDLQCSKLACFNLATDCQSMFKAAFEGLGDEQKQGTVDEQLALSAPNPDVVHAGKNIHRSHCNLLFICRQSTLQYRSAANGKGLLRHLCPTNCQLLSPTWL